MSLITLFVLVCVMMVWVVCGVGLACGINEWGHVITCMLVLLIPVVRVELAQLLTTSNKMKENKKRTYLSGKHQNNTTKKLKGDNKSNNTKMHPNNLYKDSPPNFSSLASKYESFSPLYFSS